MGEHRSAKPASDGTLVIDDVIVEHRRRHVDLDVRVRNTGRSVINITRANLHILERVTAWPSQKFPPHMILRLMVRMVRLQLQQKLQFDEVDRFAIKVGFTGRNMSHQFTAELILTYNEDDQAAAALESALR